MLNIQKIFKRFSNNISLTQPYQKRYVTLMHELMLVKFRFGYGRGAYFMLPKTISYIAFFGQLCQFRHLYD